MYAPGRRIPPGSVSLITCNLERIVSSGWEVDDGSGGRWVVQMAVEPPFAKGPVHEGHNRSIVIGKSFGGDVETPHRRVPDGLMRVDAEGVEQ